MSDELVLPLRERIKLGPLEFSELTLREPDGETLQLADREDQMGAVFVKISRTAKVSPAVAKKMRQRDLQRAANFFAKFSKVDAEDFGEEFTLKLSAAVEIDGKVISEVILSEPTGEALQIADREVGWGEVCSLVSSTGGVSRDVVKKMRQSDLQRARNFFVQFSEELHSLSSEITQPS